MEVGSGGGVGVGGRGDLGERRGVGRSSIGDRGRSSIGDGSMSYGGDLRDRGGVGQRSGMGDLGNRGSIGKGCGVCNVCDWSDGFDGNGGGFLADYGVESVDWVSGVVDDASGAIGLQEGVASLNEVAVAGLLLALGITGQAVVHVVGIAVLWMRVVVGVDGLGDGGGDDRGGRSVGRGGCSVGQGGRCDNTGIGGGDQGSESDKLGKKIIN